MASFYLDTSAYAKRYRRELGSVWVRRLCRVELVAVSMLAIAEFGSVTARLAREGAITSAQQNSMLRSFQTDVDQSNLVEVDRAVLERSSELLLTAPPSIALRSLDAIHLASAERALAAVPAAQRRRARPSFVASVLRLLATAQWLGLATDNPENHP